jgi:hypothetical protein
MDVKRKKYTNSGMIIQTSIHFKIKISPGINKYLLLACYLCHPGTY